MWSASAAAGVGGGCEIVLPQRSWRMRHFAGAIEPLAKLISGAHHTGSFFSRSVLGWREFEFVL